MGAQVVFQAVSIVGSWSCRLLIARFHCLKSKSICCRFFREEPANCFLLKRNRPGFDPALL